MTLFKSKYRVETTRLRSWDYAADAWYFVTICTHDRAHFFGEIVDNAMRLSAIGEVAHKYWAETPQHFKHVALDEFVVMPNHAHGIVIVNRGGMQVDEGMGDTSHPAPSVETRHVASLPPSTMHSKPQTQHPTFPPLSPTPPSEAANKFGPLKTGSLQAVVHSHKSAVTRWCRKNNYAEFAWQPLYYDHIIRSEESLRKIRDYIANNPSKWALDKENQPWLWM